MATDNNNFNYLIVFFFCVLGMFRRLMKIHCFKSCWKGRINYKNSHLQYLPWIKLKKVNSHIELHTSLAFCSFLTEKSNLPIPTPGLILKPINVCTVVRKIKIKNYRNDNNKRQFNLTCNIFWKQNPSFQSVWRVPSLLAADWNPPKTERIRWLLA